MRQTKTFQNRIEPWLSVPDAVNALTFYKAAFNAVETYRLETPDGGLVVKLSVEGAAFWLAGVNVEQSKSNAQSLACDNIRMILIVSDPDKVFANALTAGASEVFALTEQHSWRLGRIVDPFGLHWEIGHPLSE